MSTTPATMIDFNRLALLRLLAGLFVMAGTAPGGAVVDRLPRCVRLAIFRLLRPIESAARRLMAARAHEMNVPDDDPVTERKNGSRKGKTSKSGRGGGFPMFDAIPDTHKTRRKKRSGIEPRILSFDEPFTPQIVPEPPNPLPDDLFDSARLCGRLQVLQAVLENLDKRAMRFAKELARRRRSDVQRKKRVRGLRPLPPGYREVEDSEVDRILSACMLLEREMQKMPRGREPPDRRS